MSEGVSRRARIVVFLVVFLTVAGGGLAWVYSRPAVYGATARLNVQPPPSVDVAQRFQFVAQEAQSIRSGALLDVVARRMGGVQVSDPADVVSNAWRVSAEAIAQTTIVELRGESGDRTALVEAMRAWIQAYLEARRKADQQGGAEALEAAREEVRAAKGRVEAKRREADAFRKSHEIVSLERDENTSASRLRGLQAALNDAATREVNAEARLKAVSDGIAQGKGGVRGADRQTIAQLELRVLELRQRMQEMENDYTPQYLAMEPKAKALRANIARAEQAVAREVERSQKAALAEAEEDLASARRAAARLREQIEARKQESLGFTARFGELQRMQRDVESADEIFRVAADRLAGLESRAKASVSRVDVLVPVTAAEHPLRPDYGRDAAIAGGGGLAAALVAVLLMDFLGRRERPPEPVAPAAPVIQIAYPVLGAPVAPLLDAPHAVSHPVGALPSSVWRAPRELAPDEVRLLVAAAGGPARAAVLGILLGLSPDEVAALHWSDVDPAAGAIHVSGASARTLSHCGPLLDVLAGLAQAGPQARVLAGAPGVTLDASDIEGWVACAARDAGLARPDEIDAAALRHTLLAFLARQGARLGDLTSIVGWIPPAAFNEYARLSPPGPGIALAAIDPVMPALRGAH